MGCIQKEKSILLISKIKKKDNLDLKYMSPNIIPKNKIIDKITQKNWFQILNFLSFSDLKELGKVNRIFNYYVKQKEILVKFFRRTKSTCTDNSSIKKYQNRNSDFNKKTLQNLIFYHFQYYKIIQIILLIMMILLLIILVIKYLLLKKLLIYKFFEIIRKVNIN